MDKLAEFAKHNAIHRDALLHKVKLYKDKFQTIREPEQFHKLIDAVDGILTDIEQLLVRQNGKKVDPRGGHTPKYCRVYFWLKIDL